MNHHIIYHYSIEEPHVRNVFLSVIEAYSRLKTIPCSVTLHSAAAAADDAAAASAAALLPK